MEHFNNGGFSIQSINDYENVIGSYVKKILTERVISPKKKIIMESQTGLEVVREGMQELSGESDVSSTPKKKETTTNIRKSQPIEKSIMEKSIELEVNSFINDDDTDTDTDVEVDILCDNMCTPRCETMIFCADASYAKKDELLYEAQCSTCKVKIDTKFFRMGNVHYCKFYGVEDENKCNNIECNKCATPSTTQRSKRRSLKR